MQVSGRRVVLLSYAVMVATAALLGLVLGAVIFPRRLDGPVPVASLGPLSFPITPATMAVYGAVTVAVGYGALLLLVRVVARYDDAADGDLEAT